MLDTRQLEKLRSEIALNSIYINDYENSLNICPKDAYEFFNSYMDELGYLMEQDGIDDDHFWDNIEKYDTIDNLENFYGSYEDDPLPYDEVYEYMREYGIDWGNGQYYENLRRERLNQ